MFNFKFKNIGGARSDVESVPADANTLTSTGCYIRQNTHSNGEASNIRSEAIILYQDKPIIGVNRTWLIELNKRKKISRIVRQNITRPHMIPLQKLLVDLVNFENYGTFQGSNGVAAKTEVIRVLRHYMGSGFSISNGSNALADYNKTSYVIGIDKNVNQCVNLGGEPNLGELGKEAFERELLEETGFDINNQNHSMGSRHYCIGTKAQVDLTPAAYNILVANYTNKYQNNDTELQSLFHGNVCIAGSNVGSNCNNAVLPPFPRIGLNGNPIEPDDYHRNVTVNDNNYTRGIYLQKYLKYKKKYLELKSKINNIN